MFFDFPISTIFRNAPWGGPHGTGDIVLLGYGDWTGASFVWTFKDKPGGAAYFTLTNAAPGSQGVSAEYEPDYVAPDGTVMGATIIRPFISEATINAVPPAQIPSAPVPMFHALHVTPVGLPEIVLCTGSAPVNPE